MPVEDEDANLAVFMKLTNLFTGSDVERQIRGGFLSNECDKDPDTGNSVQNKEPISIFMLKLKDSLKILDPYFTTSLLDEKENKKFEGKGNQEEDRQKASEDVTRREVPGEGENREKEARGEKGAGDDEEEVEEEEEEDEEDEEEEEEDEDEEEDDEEEEEDDKGKRKENADSNILFELNSNDCSAQILKLNRIKCMRLLYVYLENYNDQTKRANIENKISGSSYCNSFNEIIDLYNNKSECISPNSDNEYCQEVQQYREKYQNINISNLSCTGTKSQSYSQEHETRSEQLQVEESEQTILRHGTRSDAATGNPTDELLDAKPKSAEGSPNPGLAAGVLPNGGVVIEKQPLGMGDQTSESVQVHSQTLTSSSINGNYTLISLSSTSCPNGSNKEPCDDSLQESAATERENTNELGLPKQKHADGHTEINVNSQEENGNTSTTITSATSVLGIPLFTPIGSLLNKRREKKPTWNINEAQYDQNLLYNSELRNANSNNIKYNIGYYSLINS
ncbi:PIR protein [Plasmodium ovale]|uniref:PIR protein n=1 Tax=Plasmodium ovale TaxID=36330 RepID=A0A1D3JEK2_PLAOA|nr:PIR protein [Plasmodium ovale]